MAKVYPKLTSPFEALSKPDFGIRRFHLSGLRPFGPFTVLEKLRSDMNFIILHRVAGPRFSNATHVAMDGFTRVESIFHWGYPAPGVEACSRNIPRKVGRKVGTSTANATRQAASAKLGNDLTTPHAEFGFPGLRHGDQWCLCAARWQQALDAGVAPRVVL